MKYPETSITRRTALTAGTAAAAGLVLAGTGVASPASARTAQTHLTPPWWLTLSPTQQVAQRVIYSYPGPTPPDSLLQLITAGQVGGVIFFGENITDLDQITAVVQQLNQAHDAGPVSSPLLLMTDQEGGFIRRLRNVAPVLSEKAIGLSPDPLGAATDAGTGAGQVLAQVGMNVNLAPVLDVFREPGNFDDQWERSYSSDPGVAGSLGGAFVTAQQRAGVAATAKHFPGLGAATQEQNTDLVQVTLDQPLTELRSIDEAAFAPSIAAGVDLVMTSWAVYPSLDPVNPAGLSPRIVEGELRARMRYRGVTITDALEAGSLAPFGDTGQRALRSAQAGMDLLLCSARDLTQGQAAVATLTQALTDHRLSPLSFLLSLRRVRALRDRLA